MSSQPIYLNTSAQQARRLRLALAASSSYRPLAVRLALAGHQLITEDTVETRVEVLTYALSVAEKATTRAMREGRDDDAFALRRAHSEIAALLEAESQ